MHRLAATGVAFHRVAALVVVGALAAGCSNEVPIVPVRGQVFYKEKPLKFGSVMFQPASGQPARAEIQPDGTFVLSTLRPEDGARVGKQKVRITCYSAQDPAHQADRSQGEQTLGKLLIPERYTKYATSGYEVEVKPGDNEPFIFRLTEK